MGHSRKRRKSKASPNTTPTTSPDVEIRKVKKIKQTVKKSKLEQDKESVISSSKQTIERPIEPVQSGNNTVETLSVISEFSGRSEHSDTDQFLDADDHFNADEMQTQDNTSALETTIMDAGIPGSMDESLFPSQTPQNYQHLPPTLSQYTSTPTNVVHIPQYPQMPAAPQLSFPQTGLADADVIRIATLVKQMLTEEIDRLVKEKVALETAELRNTVSTLKADNKKLADSISELEVKLSTRVDDLEQYSRRPCLRIAGLPEQDDEDTDLLVLELAGRLNADVQETDIEVSHRVGPSRGSTDDDRIGDPDGRNIKRREIIVKFRNPKARLSLLKSRTKLRKNKERLYINEDLTPTRKTLAFQCRQLRRVGKIQKTWVYNGTVNILDNGGNKVKISHISHLHPYGIETLLDNPGALH